MIPVPPPRNPPYWLDTSQPSKHPRLDRNVECDVCVIGGGIAGLTTALMLTRAGRNVVVVERNRLGSGMTGFTSAHLSSAIDDRFVTIEKLHGRDATRLAWQSHAAALDLIESLVEAENISCDFMRVPGFLVPAASDHSDLIDAEFESARGLGVGVQRLTDGPMGFSGPVLRFESQAQFHPIK